MTRALTSLLLLIALAGCVPAFADEAAPIDATVTNLYIVSNAEVRKGWRRDQVMEDGTNLVDRSGTIAAKADSADIETVSNGTDQIAIKLARDLKDIDTIQVNKNVTVGDINIDGDKNQIHNVQAVGSEIVHDVRVHRDLVFLHVELIAQDRPDLFKYHVSSS